MIKNLLKIFSILIIIGFSFKDATPPLATGWYAQYLPDTSINHIKEIYFIDSLKGFLVRGSQLLYKTTNSGNNWILNYDVGSGNNLGNIYFHGIDTGIVLNSHYLLKTTNQGLNWTTSNLPFGISGTNMNVINFDTIWIAADDGMQGLIYVTTNGGINWQFKFQGNSWPLKHIYFYNKNIGYCSDEEMKIYKTTDGGNNWFLYINEPMFQIYFIDSLIGWRCYDSLKKTTNGGASWFLQQIPQTNMSNSGYGMERFFVLNKDTIWGVGGIVDFLANSGRGIIYKTTNGGLNWGYQLPDTSIHFYQYKTCQFINKNNGWCYNIINGGVHTTSGGSDTTIFTSIKNKETKIKTKFILFQNYPNPFNPSTTIAYYLYSSAFVELKVYDITGKLISKLISKKQNEGNYEYNFDGNKLSSGIYFYNIKISDKEGNIHSESKRMILLK